MELSLAYCMCVCLMHVQAWTNCVPDAKNLLDAPDFPGAHILHILTLWHMYAHSHTNSSSKRTYYRLKEIQILLKKLLLRLNFQDEVQLYASCLFYIFNSGLENGHILLKMYFWSLTSKFKVTCMPIIYSILSLFNGNSFFFKMNSFFHSFFCGIRMQTFSS